MPAECELHTDQRGQRSHHQPPALLMTKLRPPNVCTTCSTPAFQALAEVTFTTGGTVNRWSPGDSPRVVEHAPLTNIAFPPAEMISDTTV